MFPPGGLSQSIKSAISAESLEYVYLPFRSVNNFSYTPLTPHSYIIINKFLEDKGLIAPYWNTINTY